jgi:AraC-like DNA-binding protein
MESFSTRGLPAARKVTYWNEISRDTFAHMDVQPHDTGRFDGALCRERVGPLTFMDVFSAAVRIRHTRAHIAQMSSPSYLLLAPLQRELELTMEGVPPIRVCAGEFCLLDHARPYELVHGDAVRTICVDLPRQSWDARVPVTSALVGKRMRADSAMSRMLVRHLQSVACEIGPDRSSILPPGFGQSLLDFITATYMASIEVPVGRGVAARAEAYRAYIDANCADPELTPAAVASHFQISERYMRTVLSSEGGDSFSEHLLRRRLERSAALLRDPHRFGSWITTVAFEAGFSNPTHFGSAFKFRYGVTPREYRRAQNVARAESPAV